MRHANLSPLFFERSRIFEGESRSSRLLSNDSNAGFTLIELIITAGILVLLSVGVISGYNNFNDTQRVQLAAKTLETNLRFAQAKAFSGQKPTGCIGLIGYDITFSSSQYIIQANCSSGSDGSSTVVTLPAGITITPAPWTMIFKVLTRGVDNATIISINSSSKTYKVTVSASGDIVSQ